MADSHRGHRCCLLAWNKVIRISTEVMIAIRTIEEELSELKKTNGHGSFLYASPSETFSSICKNHLRHIKRIDKHGVYITRQKSTNQILYVGKGGTINDQGTFKRQDIPGRLTNRKGKISSNEWFKTLLSEKGVLVIEYLFLNKTPISPAVVEAVLLQAYLNEYRQLPYRSNEL
jgi:hypothetical protein